MQDPQSGDWILYYVAAPNDSATSSNVPHPGPYDSRRYVVGMARAPHDFVGDSDWTDLGALWITHEAHPGGPGFRIWESPHVFRRSWNGEDLWFLFASVGRGQWADEVDFMTGPSPTLDRFAKNRRPGWTWGGRIDSLNIIDQYGNRNSSYGWFATDHFRDDVTGLEYFGNCASGVIELRQLKWRDSDYGFDLEQPFRVTGIAASPSNASAGLTVTLSFLARNANDGAGAKTAAIEVLRVSAEHESLEVLSNASVGLPSAIAITADETQVPWILPPLGSDVVHVRVRLAPPNTDVQTVLTITPLVRPRFVRPSGGASSTPAPDAVPTQSGPTVQPPSLRARSSSPPGPPNLVIELPDPARARLDLLDVGGRRVRRLVDEDLPRGATSVIWDGRDDRGRSLPRGLYFARLSVGDRVRTARVLLIR